MTDSHARLDAKELGAADAYRLMTDLVAPRPIAWVSTVNARGGHNLAPFSYFQGVCSKPPTVVLGIGWRADGRPKDTLANILDQREFTVSHVGRDHAEAMNRTSADVGPEVDEWTLGGSGLVSAPSHHVVPPRIADAHAALECRLVHAIPLGRGPTGMPSSTLVVGEVVCFVVRQSLLARNPRGRLAPMDPAALQAVGRLGGIAYTTTSDRFELARPATRAPDEPTGSGAR
ncbi:MAG: flavin reductase family protein [Myxococcota bacterium]